MAGQSDATTRGARKANAFGLRGRILRLVGASPADHARLSRTWPIAVSLLAAALLAASLFMNATAEPTTPPATQPGGPRQLRAGQVLRISDRDVRDFYKRNLDLFTLPEQVQVKRIIVATRKAAEDARARALKGEDFDSLIAEYFIPYFAAIFDKPGAPNKHLICSSWETRKWLTRWKADHLGRGEISEAVQLGGAPEYYVTKIVAERHLGLLTFKRVADNVYAHLCNTLRDRGRAAHPLDLGRWTVEGYPDAYSKYLDLAHDLEKKGAFEDAGGAALLALSWKPACRDLKKLKEFPEEQIVQNTGMDLSRYYRGLVTGAAPGSSGLRAMVVHRLVVMDRDKAAECFIRQLEYGEDDLLIYWLGELKDPKAIPVLKKFLLSERIHVLEHSAGTEYSISIIYPIRIAAMKALGALGVETHGVVTTIGPKVTHNRE